MEKFGSGIRDKHPGSATLVINNNFYQCDAGRLQGELLPAVRDKMPESELAGAGSLLQNIQHPQAGGTLFSEVFS
jgi:hypothetical protein